jgi:hypothetical protein
MVCKRVQTSKYHACESVECVQCLSTYPPIHLSTYIQGGQRLGLGWAEAGQRLGIGEHRVGRGWAEAGQRLGRGGQRLGRDWA